MENRIAVGLGKTGKTLSSIENLLDFVLTYVVFTCTIVLKLKLNQDDINCRRTRMV